MIQLHPHQSELVDNVRDHLRHGARRILVQSPTGFGKTVVAGFMIRESSHRGRRSWLWCHRRELVRQSSIALNKFGVDHGFIAAGRPMAQHKLVHVASIETLRRRLDRVKTPDLVFVDEAHHSCSRTWTETLQNFPRAIILGFTATPELLDGRGLESNYDVMVQGPSTDWLIKNGFLCEYRYFEPPSVINPSDLHTRAGDYDTTQQAKILDRASITGDVVDHYITEASGRRGIIFASSLEHSRHVAEQFCARGIPSEHVDGKTQADVRDAAIRRLETGKTKILVNVGLFTEGIDLPVVEYIGLLRLTQSLALYLQMVGRGLRTSPGKQDCIIMDHVGNAKIHSYPRHPREWSLEARSRKARAKKPDTIRVWCCPKCLATNYFSDKFCTCGYIPLAKSREIDEIAGQLKEVTESEIREMQARRRRQQGQARTTEELIREGTRRGMTDPAGWARHVIAGRTGRFARYTGQ